MTPHFSHTTCSYIRRVLTHIPPALNSLLTHRLLTCKVDIFSPALHHTMSSFPSKPSLRPQGAKFTLQFGKPPSCIRRNLNTKPACDIFIIYGGWSVSLQYFTPLNPATFWKAAHLSGLSSDSRRFFIRCCWFFIFNTSTTGCFLFFNSVDPEISLSGHAAVIIHSILYYRLLHVSKLHEIVHLFNSEYFI